MAATSIHFWFLAMLVFPVVGYALTIYLCNVSSPDNQSLKGVVEVTRSLFTALFGGMVFIGLMNCLLYAVGFRSKGIGKGSLASRWMKRTRGKLDPQSIFARLQHCGVQGIEPMFSCLFLILGAGLGSLLDRCLRE